MTERRALKAAHIDMLMKLTPIVNFINVLRTQAKQAKK